MDVKQFTIHPYTVTLPKPVATALVREGRQGPAEPASENSRL